MTVTLRPARPADRDAVRRVVVAAFGDQGPRVADLVESLGAAGHTRAALVAEAGDEIVGHVQLSRGWIDARERLVEALTLSPLSVVPDRQGRGIGTALLAAAVTAARDTGAPAVFLEGSPSYYGRRGFRPAAGLGFERPSVRCPEPAFQVVVFDTREEWMSGRFVYAGTFWELDCVGLRDPVLAELERGLDGPP